MKTTREIAEIRELSKELNPSQVQRELEEAYAKLPVEQRTLIRTEALSIRKKVNSYLTLSGSQELISKLSMYLLEKGAI